MRILLLLAGLTLSLAAMPQEIYRWVDKDGVVHYSDQPGAPGAKRVEVILPNSYEPEPSDLGVGAQGGWQPEPEVSPYTSLVIVQPTHDQVFFGGDTAVTVAANLGGTLRPGHTLVFFLNGSRRDTDAGGNLTLTSVERGTHLLRASVLDQNGNMVISSAQIAFHVRQPSINTPQSPQRPAPPAQPRPQPQPAN
ncbi:MAG: DUF4124 domain-containing protein [Steroidobacteraceae bacterium]|nr:DUF4124 domain-containing protein [Steroidobacteraceae bacterium]